MDYAKLYPQEYHLAFRPPPITWSTKSDKYLHAVSQVHHFLNILSPPIPPPKHHRLRLDLLLYLTGAGHHTAHAISFIVQHATHILWCSPHQLAEIHCFTRIRRIGLTIIKLQYIGSLDSVKM